MFKSLVSTALIAAATFVSPAIAGTDAVPQIRVTVADLDLATVTGQAKLDHRVTIAIQQVCGSADVRDLDGQAQIRRCREQASAGIAPRRAAMIAAATPTGDHKAMASR